MTAQAEIIDAGGRELAGAAGMRERAGGLCFNQCGSLSIASLPTVVMSGCWSRRLATSWDYFGPSPQ